MKQLLLLLFLLSFFFILQAQTASKDSAVSAAIADSLSKAKQKAVWDSTEKVLMAKTTYPLIKGSKYAGVIRVNDINEKPDVTQHFKLLLEITKGIKDSAAAKEINDDLTEVGRQLNLHLAAGIPQKNIDIVVVAHGSILKTFYTDAVYKEKYKVVNPNDSLLTQLRSAGVKFIACGQAMNFINIDKAQIFPWVKVALSAQTVITDYQLKGYIHRDLSSR